MQDSDRNINAVSTSKQPLFEVSTSVPRLGTGKAGRISCFRIMRDEFVSKHRNIKLNNSQRK